MGRVEGYKMLKQKYIQLIIVVLILILLGLVVNIVVTLRLTAAITSEPCTAVPKGFVFNYPDCANKLLESMNVSDIKIESRSSLQG